LRNTYTDYFARRPKVKTPFLQKLHAVPHYALVWYNSSMGLVIWHGNESTHLCGLLVLLNTLSFPMKNRFFVPQPRMYTGTRGIFFTLKIYMSKNNNGACHRASLLSFHHVFASFRAQLLLCLFVGLFVGCCIVTQNAGSTPSNLPPPPPRVVYLIIVKLYINMKS
jgi:hypothetical protein